ncbi:Transcriptional regulator, AraC family [Alloactinosynnema sp. L-07]|uniref:GlxA family transcriptional regulator n=1 Tax=Alloactinosynnema sp. L-07 TaxID=1653480 RepID=UPI00065F0950|nr:helix-turn-helix domain-containing protein [Alloactinosynnema sp. L-07]CRK58259.1 Transcriptional regulator, AraC family [Alloactinosynnema sp. L-07]
MRSIALAVVAGVPLYELAAPSDVFGVNRHWLADPWYDFTVCTPDRDRLSAWYPPGSVRGLDDLAAADTVVVPAVPDVDSAPPADLVDAVRAAHAAGARVVSLCTGAFVLAAAGLLDDKRATTHWIHAPVLAARHPAVQVDPSVLYIDNGTILTSAGKAAAMDLCLHIVRTDYGVAVANALARVLIVPPHRSGGQAQFIANPVPEERGHPLSDLFAWLLANLDQPLTVADMARRIHLSARSLTRHFAAVTGTSPLQWVLTQRIHRAQELLETTADGVDAIATRTGMGTATTMRRHFHRAVGVSPDTYRRTFGTAKPVP